MLAPRWPVRVERDVVAGAVPDVVDVPGRVAVGADAAVSMAYRDHHAAVFAFLRRATRDEAAAEDLLQETFIRLLTVVREGRPPEQVGAWLYRVASNLVISRGRRATTVTS